MAELADELSAFPCAVWMPRGGAQRLRTASCHSGSLGSAKPSGSQSLHWLPCDIGDDVEILIDVQDDQAREFGGRRNDQVGYRGATVHSLSASDN
jgi:hypothetical protein